ncbi:MAG TPA: Lrp/AsnC ligand binding domain-containing protein [Verrucomicrobiae bacterium]|nr:Lrp/AsnC ligand binding domain-containing protein [Verrucomicrobiae bacterium]
MKAYVNVETKPGTAIQFVKRMRERNKEIISADPIYGSFDAILVVEAPTIDDIDQIVYTIVQLDQNVTRTETSLVMGIRDTKQNENRQ